LAGVLSFYDESADRVAREVAFEAALHECAVALGQPADGHTDGHTDGRAGRNHAVVALAVGMLMQAGNCDEEAAARALARASARADQRVEQFARRLVEIQNIRLDPSA
jgi:ANTAR domain